MCLPGLHITLGVFFRLFTLLEDECHSLDIQMALSATPASGDRPNFSEYALAMQKERTMLDEKARLEGELKWCYQVLSRVVLNSTNPATDATVLAVASAIADNKKKVGELVSHLSKMGYYREQPFFFSKDKDLASLAAKYKKGLTRKEGPFVRKLDAALASFNVHRQAYYSGTFVGNHVHRTLKVHVILLLTSDP